jgi:hypothetical protein
LFCSWSAYIKRNVNNPGFQCVDNLLILCGQNCVFNCYGRKKLNCSLIRFCTRVRKYECELFAYGHMSFVRNSVTEETPVRIVYMKRVCSQCMLLGISVSVYDTYDPCGPSFCCSHKAANYAHNSKPLVIPKLLLFRN